jgi:endonuclease/exonuclease/phosphatase family metal-dependent hydrolase
MLHKSVYEKLFGWNNERALVAEFYDYRSHRKIVIVSLHATHLVASNSLRRRQIGEVFRRLEHQNAPVVIAGDYNYPLFHSKLKTFITEKEYELHIPPDVTYKARKYKGKFDFVSTRHVLSTQLSVLPEGQSDHSPIQALIEY